MTQHAHKKGPSWPFSDIWGDEKDQVKNYLTLVWKEEAKGTDGESPYVILKVQTDYDLAL